MQLMMDGARKQQWQAILQITEQLDQLSADENWSSMIELGAERQDKLEQFFLTKVPPSEAQAIADDIRHIMQSDERLKQAGLKQQQVMSAGIKKLVTGKQVIKAYGDVAVGWGEE